MKKLKNSVDIAKEVIFGYYQSLANKDTLNSVGFNEMMAIKFDTTNKVLLEHIKALKNIFEDAIKEIENGGDEE